MRIRVWNAFASNNSGSYTIVGRFDTAERAAEVAKALSEMIEAHTAWHEQHSWDGSEDSPIVAFAKANSLQWSAKLGAGDEWPSYGDGPRALAVDHQVVVHAPYTVTLPRLFGEMFYAWGGEVDHTLDHAHHALVVQVEVYWPYQWPEDDRKARLVAMEAAIGESVEIWGHVKDRHLVCAHGKDWLDAPLVIGAVFDDLVEGVAAIAAMAQAHEASHRVKIFEALDLADPLSHLRAKP